MEAPRKVLVIDIGGTSVKALANGQAERRKVPSGKGLTPGKMVAGVKELAKDREDDVVSIGIPGAVREGRPAAEPNDLARGWVGFDFQAAFGCPVRMMNDAPMQALGSYRAGTMPFLGLGTGLGASLVVGGTVVPLELGHVSLGGKTFEDDLGVKGLGRLGRKKWRKRVEEVTARFVSAPLLDEFVLGGGNARKLTSLPPGCRTGDEAKAFLGGFEMREEAKR